MYQRLKIEIDYYDDDVVCASPSDENEWNDENADNNGWT